MARKFELEGPKDFLYWAIGLCLFSLWCIKDGWFPSESVLVRHPSGEDHFYLFNQSLAILMLSVSAVCAYIYKVVK